MKTLIIGDIHNQTQRANEIIAHSTQQHQHDRVVFLGDYFDSYDDVSTDQAESTAHWLAESLQHPNRIHLVGNHDFHYLLDHRRHEALACSGFTMKKHRAINSILDRSHWNQLVYFHVEQGWWLSHAGVTRKWFEHPVMGLTEEVVREYIKHELKLLDAHQIPQRLWAADHWRGGLSHQGGLLWCDWRSLSLLPNVRQIVGHTQHKRVQHRKSNNPAYAGGEAYCLDTLQEYIIIEDQQATIHTAP